MGKNTNKLRIPKNFIVLIIVFFSLAIVVGYFIHFNLQIDVVSPSISNTFNNSTFINSTITSPNETTSEPVMFHISTQMIPTIINGITTATSVIIGFSATLAGIIAHVILKDEKDKPAREYLIGTTLAIFTTTILFFFMAYRYHAKIRRKLTTERRLLDYTPYLYFIFYYYGSCSF